MNLTLKLQVLADPALKGKHPYHDSRFITTEGAHFEDGRHPSDWILENGWMIAEMRDCAKQGEIAARMVMAFNLHAELVEARKAVTELAYKLAMASPKLNPEVDWIIPAARAALDKAQEGRR